ncbi:unnamed protein product [Heterobilharzia americana]|nr:unnamed protein product [Heterobilharzia americana]
MDWACIEKADWGHHAPGTRVEAKGETMSWALVARVTWMSKCEEEMKATEQSWSQVEKTAEKRVEWRRGTESLCSIRNPREKKMIQLLIEYRELYEKPGFLYSKHNYQADSLKVRAFNNILGQYI